MGSRQSDFQRQRSALLLIDSPPRSNNDTSPRHNEVSFPVFGPIFNFDIKQHSKHTNTQRSTAQQERIHFSKAKPHCQILTPFPLWLDKRFIDQEKADLTEKHKSKQKTPSEDVRCFWALASTRLSEGQGRFNVANFAFLHFDPTREESLGYSVDSLIGTSILDFMHPIEATEIGLKILQYVLGENIGSAVFRCTKKSVASLGRYVHSTQDDLSSDFSTFARSLKSDQQLTDIRLELIGDDMLLCFFHAVEKSSIHDDDQRGKSQWSDCCYTSLDIFSDQHCQSLWQHVFSKRLIAPSSSSIQRHLTGFPRSIFQILTNGTTSSKILFSWPPPRLFDSASYHSDSSGTESYNDGSYFADDLARSAIETKFGEENLGMNQFVTACARRQIRKGKITADGVAIKFKVTLIPRGDIKFAIFSISRAEHINQEAGHNSSRGDQIFPVAFTPNRQSQPFTIANPEQQKQSSFSQTPPGLTFSKSMFSLPSMTAAPNAFTSRTPQTFNILPATGMMVDDEMREPGRRLSARVKTITSQDPSPFPMNDDKLYQLQPIQTRSGPRPNEGQITPFYFPIHRSGPHPNTFPESPTKSCLVCKASKSPEWRKGPDGNKSLCNACGLRFSRNASRVKKKEEKARNAAEAIEIGGVVPEQLRRKLEAERGKKKNGLQKQLKEHLFQQTA